MAKRILVFFSLCIFALAACSSKTDVNEKNFSNALNQYLDKKGDLCLGTTRWPVDIGAIDLRIEQSRPSASSIVSQMATLESAGLAKSEDTEIAGIGFMPGNKSKVKRYTLTDAAKPFLKEQKSVFSGTNTDICWGKTGLDKVVKWDAVAAFGGQQETKVTYTYKVNNIAEWARKPEIQSAFPSIKREMDGASSKELKRGMKLTNLGWEALGLD